MNMHAVLVVQIAEDGGASVIGRDGERDEMDFIAALALRFCLAHGATLKGVMRELRTLPECDRGSTCPSPVVITGGVG